MKLIIELFPEQERGLTAIVERGHFAGHGPVSSLAAVIAIALDIGLAHERRFRAMLATPAQPAPRPTQDVAAWAEVEEMARKSRQQELENADEPLAI